MQQWHERAPPTQEKPWLVSQAPFLAAAPVCCHPVEVWHKMCITCRHMQHGNYYVHPQSWCSYVPLEAEKYAAPFVYAVCPT